MHVPKEAPIERYQTGFQVKGIRGIVTSLHGIADCTKIDAISTADDGRRYEQLHPISVTLGLDLAVLASDEIKDDKVGFETSSDETSIKPDSIIYIIGHPHGSDGQLPRQVSINLKSTAILEDVVDSPFKNELSKRQSPSSKIPFLLLIGSILPGDSGSPVLNQKNQVVGVVDGGVTGGTGGIAWAIPWSQVKKWGRPEGDAFEAVKNHDVTKLFDFDVQESTENREELIVTLKEDNGISREITTTINASKIEEAGYDLDPNRTYPKDFNPSYVTIKRNNHDAKLVASGRVTNIKTSDIDYKVFSLESRGFWVLHIVPRLSNASSTISPTKTEFSSILKVTFVTICNQKEEPVQYEWLTLTVSKNGIKRDDSIMRKTDKDGIVLFPLSDNPMELQGIIEIGEGSDKKTIRTYRNLYDDSQKLDDKIILSPKDGCSTPTPSSIPTHTATITPTASTSTASTTSTPRATYTVTPTQTATVTSTLSSTLTRTATDTATLTRTPTVTNTSTPKTSPTVTSIPTPMPTATCPENMKLIKDASFCMDIYEVTNAAYQQCVENGPCKQPQTLYKDAKGNEYYATEKYLQYPVVGVTWEQANKYCVNFNLFTKSVTKHLPTSAQWKKAFFDKKLSSSEEFSPVGSNEQDKSPDGIYDLVGNVREWAKDKDPIIPTRSILLGKSYQKLSSWPVSFDKDSADRGIGFRCVVDVH